MANISKLVTTSPFICYYLWFVVLISSLLLSSVSHLHLLGSDSATFKLNLIELSSFSQSSLLRRQELTESTASLCKRDRITTPPSHSPPPVFLSRQQRHHHPPPPCYHGNGNVFIFVFISVSQLSFLQCRNHQPQSDVVCHGVGKISVPHAPEVTRQGIDLHEVWHKEKVSIMLLMWIRPFV